MFLTSQEEPEVLNANFQVESNKLISTKAMTETLQRHFHVTCSTRNHTTETRAPHVAFVSQVSIYYINSS